MPEVVTWGIENRALQRVATAAVLIQSVALYLATLAGMVDRTLTAVGVRTANSEVRTRNPDPDLTLTLNLTLTRSLA